MEFNIIISGVGGQGNVRAAQIIGLAALKSGYDVKITDVYGIAQRGGSVLSHVRIGENIYSPLIEEHKADIVLGLEPMECLRATINFLKIRGIVIINTRPIYPVEVLIGKAKYPDVNNIVSLIKKIAKFVLAFDATKIAEDIGLPIATNIVLIGALIGLDVIPLKKELLIEAIRESLPYNIEENIKAFNEGFSIGLKEKLSLNSLL
ncbi:MAG: indolepyruvate ferredoxin oxidoreductase subunit beta [Candidatus Verstraetearchaeota archaeon]|jgi:indolepyruvate ferredoxin oxidoreductase beta subunit|nr:indolepyruvate ferredoxin oxidoreductase subunit beta [Candidatus Methanomethylicia archaeon]NHV45823.1 indolepyruvate ferredoxin oxidoreductase subunit beta [Candidatus Verstraetearchaeota archaeon]